VTKLDIEVRHVITV